MSPFPVSKLQHLESEFLPIRAKILEIASSLDRIQRETAEDVKDPRWQQLQAGIQLLQTVEAGRAEQVQLLFSRAYDKQWQQKFKNNL